MSMYVYQFGKQRCVSTTAWDETNQTFEEFIAKLKNYNLKLKLKQLMQMLNLYAPSQYFGAVQIHAASAPQHTAPYHS